MKQTSPSPTSTKTARWEGIIKRVLWLLDPPGAPELDFYVRRVLSIITLVLAPALLFASFWTWLVPGTETWLRVTAVTLLIAYGLNRTGRLTAASGLAAVSIPLIGFASIILHPDESVWEITLSLIWMPTLLLVCFLFLNTRGMALLSVGVLAGIVAIPLIYDDIHFADIAFVLFNTLTTVALLLAGTIRRDFVQQQILQRTREIDEGQLRYRELFEATFEAIFIHRQGLIVDVNPAAEGMFGWTRADLLGRYTLELIAPEFRAIAREKYESQSLQPYEARCIRKDGTDFWVEIRGKPYLYAGEQVRVAAVRDITARKHAETDHIALAIEREKVLILQRFIGDMSHDLRTPLSVIKTSAYLIEKLATANQPERLARQLEVLHDQSNHLQRMLEDLLHMSHLDRADTSSYEFEWHIINSIVESVITDVRSIALRKNQALTFAPDEGLPKAIVDQNEFKRMLRHLLNNAISYTPEDGTITVRTLHGDGWVSLEVTDTGAGIPKLDLPHIFERFYRGDRSRSSDSGGTGLGLAIAKKIVEAHNGQIEATSELGKGSTFCVRLPALHGEVTTTKPSVTSPHPS